MREGSSRRPLITANMVTVARLLPMPLLCWLIYEGSIDSLWIALILGTLIGCTDFVDGYLARKQGPTILGGLLDPIADKVFIAFTYLPFADQANGFIPAWAVALIFVREFLVTSLRSAYEQRGMSMKTSYLGKVKTWTQMQGLGMLILFSLLSGRHDGVLTGLVVAGLVLSVVAPIALWLVKQRLWKGAVVMAGSFALLLALHLHGNVGLTLEVIIYIVVGITWLSGLDYVYMAVTQLRGRGDFRFGDFARVLGAVALPCLMFAALVETPVAGWAIVTILAVELSVGGLDNLLSHHGAAAKPALWLGRVLSVSALLALTLVLGDRELLVNVVGGAAALVSVAGVGYEFWRGRSYYLEDRHRDKEVGAVPVRGAPPAEAHGITGKARRRSG